MPILPGSFLNRVAIGPTKAFPEPAIEVFVDYNLDPSVNLISTRPGLGFNRVTDPLAVFRKTRWRFVIFLKSDRTDEEHLKT